MRMNAIQNVSAALLVLVLVLASACDSIVGTGDPVSNSRTTTPEVSFNPVVFDDIDNIVTCGEETFKIFTGQNIEIGSAIVSNDISAQSYTFSVPLEELTFDVVCGETNILIRVHDLLKIHSQPTKVICSKSL